MKWIKNKKMYLINGLFCISIFLLILFINNISPFGESMLGTSDAPIQFKPMLYGLIMRIKTGSLLNYTFNNGLGNATIFDFLYYIASPFNLIALLFKNPDLMYLSATIIKIAIAAITMTFYTSKKTNNNYVIFIATISYVFSSWFLTYYYYLPWLDIFMIFPLFQYGLEKIINEHKYHIYIFSLSYMMATNLYLCFSVCIYTLVFFIIYELLYKQESVKKKILAFDYLALATIGSFLLAFFYLYGWFDSMIKIKLGFNGNFSAAYTVSILDFLKSFYYSNISFIANMEGKTFPNIACPTIILIGLLYYFINGKVNRKKFFVFIALILCIAVIFIPQLDFIMNAFHKIRGLSYRYSFIFSFLMIQLFIKNYNETNTSKKHLIISILIILFGLVLLKKSMYNDIFIISLTFVLCYLILIVFYENNNAFKSLSIGIFILQVIFVSNVLIPNDFKKELPNNINYKLNTTTYRINNSLNSDDTDLEAINNYNNRKTTYVYSSMTYSNVIYLFKNLGVTSFENTYAVMHDNNLIPSLLLNVKNSRNNYYLEKIYAVNKEIKNNTIDEGDYKYNIENIVFNMTGIKNIYNKEILKGKISGKNYVFKTNNDYYLIELKNENGGTNIYQQEYKEFLQESKYGDGTATIYTVNEKKLKEIYNYLKKNQIKYSYYNDNHIKGTINVDKDQIIFTSIPYDKDWEVKIDGKKVKTIALLDSLMGIEVEPGKHEIELEYKTHYLIPALISISTFILLLLDLIKKRKVKSL